MIYLSLAMTIPLYDLWRWSTQVKILVWSLCHIEHLLAAFDWPWTISLLLKILYLRIETKELYSIGLKSSSVGEKSFTSCIPIAGHSDPNEGLVPRMHFSSAFQTVFVDCKIIGIYFLHRNISNHCKCSIKSALI